MVTACERTAVVTQTNVDWRPGSRPPMAVRSRVSACALPGWFQIADDRAHLLQQRDQAPVPRRAERARQLGLECLDDLVRLRPGARAGGGDVQADAAPPPAGRRSMNPSLSRRAAIWLSACWVCGARRAISAIVMPGRALTLSSSPSRGSVSGLSASAASPSAEVRTETAHSRWTSQCSHRSSSAPRAARARRGRNSGVHREGRSARPAVPDGAATALIRRPSGCFRSATSGRDSS
jgi:hypothetical protein